MSTAVSEIQRRLKNNSTEVHRQSVEDVIVDYMDNLDGMGYPQWWRAKALARTAKGYKKVMQLVEGGQTKRNRMEASTKVHRRWKKILGPSQWLKTQKEPEEVPESEKCPGHRARQKSQRDTRTPEGVMFIQTTPNSKLKNDLQTMD